MALPDNVTLVLHPVVEGGRAELDGRKRRRRPASSGARRETASRRASRPSSPATARRPPRERFRSSSTARRSRRKTVQVPAGGRATVEFPSLDVPYGFSRCEVRIDSADALPADDGYLFAVERSDPQRVLFVHAATDARSPLYFGDALALGGRVGVRPAVGLGRAGGRTCSLSKYALRRPLEPVRRCRRRSRASLLEIRAGRRQRAGGAGHVRRRPRPRADLRRRDSARARLLARIVRRSRAVPVGGRHRSVARRRSARPAACPA